MMFLLETFVSILMFVIELFSLIILFFMLKFLFFLKKEEIKTRKNNIGVEKDIETEYVETQKELKTSQEKINFFIHQALEFGRYISKELVNKFVLYVEEELIKPIEEFNKQQDEVNRLLKELK